MAAAAKTKRLSQVILAGLIGNVLEWYDFALYGYFVGIIGAQFFPSSDPNASLIAAFGAFAAGFLVRPLGGVLLGRIADRSSRRKALNISVLAMGCSTLLMAALPTYQQIGLWAPIALVMLRIIQGLSAGGEYSTSIVFLAEHAPTRHRGLVAIWGLWGSVLGMLLGSGISALVASSLEASAMQSWGWRLPFAIGLLVILSGVLLRRGLESETPPAPATRPVRALMHHHRAVLRVLLLNVASSVAFYTAFVYAISYIQTEAGQSEAFALGLNTRVMGLLLIFYPISAWVSDRLGRRPLLISGSALLLLGGPLIFQLLQSHHHTQILRGELLLMLAVALLAGAKNPANVELMPEAVRCTGLALAFNIAEGYCGGTTPLIASWLVSSSGNPQLPGYWVAASGAITLITAIWFTPETYRLRLQPNAQQ